MAPPSERPSSTTPDPSSIPDSSKPDPRKPAKILEQIGKVNQRLKVAQLGVQLELRGQKLNLRGTFPPKPGSQRLRPYQQRLSLKIPATAEGVKTAEREAKIIAAQLLAKTFDWHPYLVWSLETRQGSGGMAQKIQDFEQYFWDQGQTGQGKPDDRSASLAPRRTTWEGAYLPYLRRLAQVTQEKPHLTAPEAIYAAIETYKPHSRSRQLCCTALGAFAAFLQVDLPLDLKSLGGNYNPSKTKARTLPSDGEILEHFSTIPNPAWQFVYGIMATYGLRNHEVFFCDYSALTQGNDLPPIRVLDSTKTGEHEVWPFLPEWVDRFNLRQVQLPPVNTDLTETTLQNIGQRVTRQFRRYQLPFSPYDLRHAWAVRTINLGLPDTVAAKMMGHSVAIHTRTYHRWISRRDQQQAVEAALGRTRSS